MPNYLKRNRRWARLFVFGATLALTGARAGAVEPTHISLPSGPGSIEGLGRTFAPSLASGTAAYGVDIRVPPASNGFGPQISLEYDSSGGVGELGLGWHLGGLPSIRRRTENGLPRFDDSDAFELAGVGVSCDLLEVSPKTFRPQYESGAFARIERVDQEVWEGRTKAGVIWRFGGQSFEEAEGDHVATYLLRRAMDLHGHAIDYSWTVSNGYGYLDHIVWNDFGPDARNELLFAYEPRPDAHVLFSSGIKRVLSQRLKSIEVRHGGELVRRYDLIYVQDRQSRLAAVTLIGRDGVSAMPPLSFTYTRTSFQPALVAMQNPPGVTPSDPDTDIADVNGDGLPDFLVTQAGSYRSYVNRDGTIWEAGVNWDPAHSPSVALGSTGVQLADLDGDGALDLVVKSGTDALRYFPGKEVVSPFVWKLKMAHSPGC